MVPFKINLQYTLIILLLSLTSTGHMYAQKNANKFFLGFGGGVNASQIISNEQVNLYENLSSEELEETYNDWYSNIGNQYFFHIEYRTKKMILFGTPGTSTFNFTKNTPIVGGAEVFNQETSVVASYFSIPLGLKLFISADKTKPYLGGKVTYGHGHRANGPDNSLIPSRFSAGGLIGAYIDLNKFTIDINAGYNLGLHNITRQAERYANDGSGLYSQNNIKINDFQFNVSVLFSLEKSWKLSSLDCNY